MCDCVCVWAHFLSSLNQTNSLCSRWYHSSLLLLQFAVWCIISSIRISKLERRDFSARSSDQKVHSLLLWTAPVSSIYNSKADIRLHPLQLLLLQILPCQHWIACSCCSCRRAAQVPSWMDPGQLRSHTRPGHSEKAALWHVCVCVCVNLCGHFTSEVSHLESVFCAISPSTPAVGSNEWPSGPFPSHLI